MDFLRVIGTMEKCAQQQRLWKPNQDPLEQSCKWACKMSIRFHTECAGAQLVFCHRLLLSEKISSEFHHQKSGSRMPPIQNLQPRLRTLQTCFLKAVDNGCSPLVSCCSSWTQLGLQQGTWEPNRQHTYLSMILSSRGRESILPFGSRGSLYLGWQFEKGVTTLKNSDNCTWYHIAAS